MLTRASALRALQVGDISNILVQNWLKKNPGNPFLETEEELSKLNSWIYSAKILGNILIPVFIICLMVDYLYNFLPLPYWFFVVGAFLSYAVSRSIMKHFEEVKRVFYFDVDDFCVDYSELATFIDKGQTEIANMSFVEIKKCCIQKLDDLAVKVKAEQQVFEGKEGKVKGGALESEARKNFRISFNLCVQFLIADFKVGWSTHFEKIPDHV